MLLFFIGICLLVGYLGSLFMQVGITTWYPTLLKPAWMPPEWVFTPVGTLLYILMGIALWLIWKTPGKIDKRGAYFFFWVQLLLNLAWSFLFFYLQSPFLALFNISLLMFVIIMTILTFYPIRKSAAYLLIPYLMWIAYMTALNSAFWALNRLSP